VAVKLGVVSVDVSRGRRPRAFVAGALLAAGFAWLWIVVAAPACSGEERALDRFDVVVIDPGHGGEDEGARGAGGMAEKDLVLDVARRLAGRLRERGLRVVLTRDDDSFVPLETRTSLANDARGDLFISIHANAARSASPRGIETYFVSLEATDDAARQVAAWENRALGARPRVPVEIDPVAAILGDMTVNEHLRESSIFAKLTEAELAKMDSMPSRGVKQAPFVVLMGVRMPASLVEIGFLSNAKEEKGLRSGGRREAISEAIVRAVFAFGEDYDKRHGVDGRLSAATEGARPAVQGDAE
jgi:N-acetylmuramoyl-L-alanine amidase